MPAAIAPHRLRVLRWQARAPQPAQALALRSLLREQGDSLAQCLELALDDAAAVLGLGPETVVRIGRLELALPAPPLADPLHTDRAAWSQWLQQLRQAALAQVQQAVDGPPPVAAASRLPAAADARSALLAYLQSGWPGWALAGADDASHALRDAATALADELAPGGGGALSEAAVQTLWRWTGTPEHDPQAALGVLARWLALLPPLRRAAWVQARAVAPLARVVFSATPAPTVRALLMQWQNAAAAADAVWVQALWLGWPGDAPRQAAWRGALVSGSLLDADAPQALKRLQVALTAEATRLPAPRLHGEAAGAAVRSEPPSTPAPPAAPTSPPLVPVRDGSAPDTERRVVPLAGLVLLHPFLPRLLQGLQLHSGQQGESLSAAVLPRALALLHALACGAGPQAALELEMPLLKLLLGLPPAQGLSMPPAVLDEADVAEVQALLEAVRQHWPALRGSGVQTLRVSFLQRRGLLHRTAAPDGAAWQLQVHGEAFDLLLASLPWSLAWVKLPWMPEALSVDWPVPT